LRSTSTLEPPAECELKQETSADTGNAALIDQIITDSSREELEAIIDRAQNRLSQLDEQG